MCYVTEWWLAVLPAKAALDVVNEFYTKGGNMKFYKYAAIVLVMAMKLATVEGSAALKREADFDATRSIAPSELGGMDNELPEVNFRTLAHLGDAKKFGGLFQMRCRKLMEENERLRSIGVDDLAGTPISSKATPVRAGNMGIQLVGVVQEADADILDQSRSGNARGQSGGEQQPASAAHDYLSRESILTNLVMAAVSSGITALVVLWVKSKSKNQA